MAHTGGGAIKPKDKKKEGNRSGFLPFIVVEVEGFEPSSKRGTNGLSTCLVVTCLSESGKLSTTNLKLIL